MGRARETCELAGYGHDAVVDPDLREWDYGDDEGITTAEIRRTRPGWSVWAGGPKAGETVGQVGQRADAVLARVDAAPGDSAIFGHGHMLRVLAARWIGLPPADGRLLALDPGSWSILGLERDQHVLRAWNVGVGPR